MDSIDWYLTGAHYVAGGPRPPEPAMHTSQSSTVDLMTMLLVLAGDHRESAHANATALLRLAEPEPAAPGITASGLECSTPRR